MTDLSQPQPTVGIGLPVFNGERYVGEAIVSALAQTFPVTELRIYDNASTDDTLRVVRGLVGEGQVVTQDTNRGAVQNFNLAARSATTELFMWLAADDRLSPTFVERCVQVLAQDPEAPACLTGVRFIDPSGATTRVQEDRALASNDARIRLRSFIRRRRWTELFCLYRRSRLLVSPLMSDEYGCDVLLTWWFLLRSPLAVTAEALLEYREYPSKTVGETAAGLHPDRAVQYWRMHRLWRRLGDLTRDSGVDPRVGALARRELRLALLHPTWWIHLGSDVAERYPFLGRVLRRVWVALGQPGRLAPEGPPD